MPGDRSDIAANIQRIRERIAESARRAGREPSDITLVAVSKTVDPGRIREAVDAGIRNLGENYYQEARDKLPLFDPGIRWHFIGHLQTNKAKYVTGRFAMIQSVDSLGLAEDIGKRAAAAGVEQAVLIEVKLDESATKFGFPPESALDLAAQIGPIPGIKLQGFMGMAPFSSVPEHSRPFFARLRELFDRLPPNQRTILSMGMTVDFEVAIEEGSTMVRTGTGIFGAR